MRIAIVIERIEAWRGGAEISTMQFVRHLIDRGCHVTLFTASRGVSAPGLDVQHITVRTPFRSRKTACFARLVTARLQTTPVDLVHAITPVASADIYQPRGGLLAETLDRNLAMRSSTAARRLKRLTSALNGKHRTQARLERALLTRQPPPVVLALSAYVARQLETHFNLTAPAVRVVFNGVDVDPVSADRQREDARRIRDQYGLEPGDFVLLLVAHNFRLKGVGALVRAVRLLADKALPVRALVVGRDNPMRFRRQAIEEGIADRVIFTGPTPCVRALYHAADVLVHPTYYDPCSRVVLEALSAGLPCVTTRFNGAAEVIVDGQHGYVIDSPDDVDALADRLARLADADHRARCAEAAARLREQLSMARQADEIITVYRELLDERTPPCPPRSSPPA